jgi:hypothetical protein
MQSVNYLQDEVDVRSMTKKTTGRMMTAAPMRRTAATIPARSNIFCFDVKALKDKNHRRQQKH